MPFDFYLVNSECGGYLAVDCRLVYSYHKMFLQFFSLTFSVISVLKASIAIHILVLFAFCFLLLDLAVELEFCPQLSTMSALAFRYSVIYSEKHILYLGKFNQVFEVLHGLFLFLPLVAKRCAGDDVDCWFLKTTFILNNRMGAGFQTGGFWTRNKNKSWFLNRG